MQHSPPGLHKLCRPQNIGPTGRRLWQIIKINVGHSQGALHKQKMKQELQKASVRKKHPEPFRIPITTPIEMLMMTNGVVLGFKPGLVSGFFTS